MWESVVIMSVVGLLAGFFFSMPIAGPISILVTSNALKGRTRYCNLVAIGASIADLFYVFLAVYGITRLYPFVKPAMPYIMAFGAIFLFYVGYKIFRTKLNLEQLEEFEPNTGKPIRKDRGGFYTGFMVNFLNPTLVFGWLATSVLVITFAASLGLDTGGLNTMVDQNVRTLNGIDSTAIENNRMQNYMRPDTLKFLRNAPPREPVTRPSWFPVLISFSYALALSVGSILWYLILAVIISRFRRWINVRALQGIISGLGIVLCLFGLYFAYSAVKMWI